MTSLHALTPETLERVVGSEANHLIQLITQEAQKQSLTVCMVGGVIRDWLVDYASNDIDFMVEGDAIKFATFLGEIYGGIVRKHTEFGTATWFVDEQVINLLKVSGVSLPDHIDFAMAREETYEEPAALPKVRPSTIQADLFRRDFTINALALQLSPAEKSWHLHDYYDGMRDLENGILRVMHPQSFVDDPTRILRGVRLAQRFGFHFDAATRNTIPDAFPALRKITGSRLLQEFNYINQEPQPENSWRALSEFEVLHAIHRAFMLPDRLVEYFEAIRSDEFTWDLTEEQMHIVHWLLILSGISLAQVGDVCNRLEHGNNVIDHLFQLHEFLDRIDQLSEPDLPPSGAVRFLQPYDETVRVSTWLVTTNLVARRQIRRYDMKWRNIRPFTTGDTLLEWGIPPGPKYKVILTELRDAWLDGLVKSEQDEIQLLKTIIDRWKNE